jgi:hypothetical protein
VTTRRGEDGEPTSEATAIRNSLHQIKNLICGEVLGWSRPSFASLISDPLVLARAFRALGVRPNGLFHDSSFVASLTPSVLLQRL